MFLLGVCFEKWIIFCTFASELLLNFQIYKFTNFQINEV